MEKITKHFYDMRSDIDCDQSDLMRVWVWMDAEGLSLNGRKSVFFGLWRRFERKICVFGDELETNWRQIGEKLETN